MPEGPSFDAVYAEYGAAVLRFVLLRIRNPPEAEDVTADVFVAAFRAYDPRNPPDSIRAWLFRIASNRVTDFWRRKKRWNPLQRRLTDGLRSASNVEVAFEKKTELEEILERLATFSERDQTIVALRLSGSTHAEIGRILGISENAAAIAGGRAFARLRGKDAPE